MNSGVEQAERSTLATERKRALALLEEMRQHQKPQLIHASSITSVDLPQIQHDASSSVPGFTVVIPKPNVDRPEPATSRPQLPALPTIASEVSKGATPRQHLYKGHIRESARRAWDGPVPATLCIDPLLTLRECIKALLSHPDKYGSAHQQLESEYQYVLQLYASNAEEGSSLVSIHENWFDSRMTSATDRIPAASRARPGELHEVSIADLSREITHLRKELLRATSGRDHYRSEADRLRLELVEQTDEVKRLERYVAENEARAVGSKQELGALAAENHRLKLELMAYEDSRRKDSNLKRKLESQAEQRLIDAKTEIAGLYAQLKVMNQRLQLMDREVHMTLEEREKFETKFLNATKEADDANDAMQNRESQITALQKTLETEAEQYLRLQHAVRDLLFFTGRSSLYEMLAFPPSDPTTITTAHVAQANGTIQITAGDVWQRFFASDRVKSRVVAAPHVAATAVAFVQAVDTVCDRVALRSDRVSSTRRAEPPQCFSAAEMFERHSGTLWFGVLEACATIGWGAAGRLREGLLAVDAAANRPQQQNEGDPAPPDVTVIPANHWANLLLISFAPALFASVAPPPLSLVVRYPFARPPIPATTTRPTTTPQLRTCLDTRPSLDRVIIPPAMHGGELGHTHARSQTSPEEKSLSVSLEQSGPGVGSPPRAMDISMLTTAFATSAAVPSPIDWRWAHVAKASLSKLRTTLWDVLRLASMEQPGFFPRGSKARSAAELATSLESFKVKNLKLSKSEISRIVSSLLTARYAHLLNATSVESVTGCSTAAADLAVAGQQPRVLSPSTQASNPPLLSRSSSIMQKPAGATDERPPLLPFARGLIPFPAFVRQFFVGRGSPPEANLSDPAASNDRTGTLGSAIVQDAMVFLGSSVAPEHAAAESLPSVMPLQSLEVMALVLNFVNDVTLSGVAGGDGDVDFTLFTLLSHALIPEQLFADVYFNLDVLCTCCIEIATSLSAHHQPLSPINDLKLPLQAFAALLREQGFLVTLSRPVYAADGACNESPPLTKRRRLPFTALEIMRVVAAVSRDNSGSTEISVSNMLFSHEQPSSLLRSCFYSEYVRIILGRFEDDKKDLIDHILLRAHSDRSSPRSASGGSWENVKDVDLDLNVLRSIWSSHAPYLSQPEVEQLLFALSRPMPPTTLDGLDDDMRALACAGYHMDSIKATVARNTTPRQKKNNGPGKRQTEKSPATTVESLPIAPLTMLMAFSRDEWFDIVLVDTASSAGDAMNIVRGYRNEGTANDGERPPLKCWRRLCAVDVMDSYFRFDAAVGRIAEYNSEKLTASLTKGIFSSFAVRRMSALPSPPPGTYLDDYEYYLMPRTVKLHTVLNRLPKLYSGIFNFNRRSADTEAYDVSTTIYDIFRELDANNIPLAHASANGAPSEEAALLRGATLEARIVAKFSTMRGDTEVLWNPKRSSFSMYGGSHTSNEATTDPAQSEAMLTPEQITWLCGIERVACLGHYARADSQTWKRFAFRSLIEHHVSQCTSAPDDYALQHLATTFGVLSGNRERRKSSRAKPTSATRNGSVGTATAVLGTADLTPLTKSQLSAYRAEYGLCASPLFVAQSVHDSWCSAHDIFAVAVGNVPRNVGANAVTTETAAPFRNQLPTGWVI